MNNAWKTLGAEREDAVVCTAVVLLTLLPLMFADHNSKCDQLIAQKYVLVVVVLSLSWLHAVCAIAVAGHVCIKAPTV